MLIPTFQKKSPLTAADLNLLGDTVRRARVLPGVGIKLTETLNGTVVSLKPTRGAGGGGSSSVENRPFDIINLRGSGQPDQNGKFSSYKAEIWPGSIATILPSNIFLNGTLQTFTVSAALTYWKVKVFTNGLQITQAIISANQILPAQQLLVPSALPAEAEFVFGMTFEGTTYRTLGPGNPTVFINQAIVTDKTTPPPPGIPGIDRWYRIDIV
jgi:hypothetical protein